MLTNARRTRFQLLKSLGYALLAGAGMTQTALVVFAADNAPPTDAIPIVRINPVYPQAALTAGMEGWVHIEFSIDERGAVVDPIVVDNSVCLRGQEPRDCGPDDMFNSSALNAVSKWRYSPKIEDGQPVVREDMSTIIRFELVDGDE